MRGSHTGLLDHGLNSTVYCISLGVLHHHAIVLRSIGPPTMELSHRHGTSATSNPVQPDHLRKRIPPMTTSQDSHRKPLKSAHRAISVPSPHCSHIGRFTYHEHGGVCNTPCYYTRDSESRRTSVQSQMGFSPQYEVITHM